LTPVRWTVMRDDNGSPMIFSCCDSCHAQGNEGRRYFATAAAPDQVFHCIHWSEKAPRHVADAFREAFKKYVAVPKQQEPFYKK
jgi:hypothetical protein